MEVRKNGLTLKIIRDVTSNPNPREHNDNLGTMYCFHGRYRLGDETKLDDPEKFNDWFRHNEDNIFCMLPLYLYDHSGICMSTVDFNDPWDSRQIGLIICTKEDLEKHGLTDMSKAEIEEKLIQEVKEYSNYLEGNDFLYFFTILDDRDHVIDSGFDYKNEKLKDMLNKMSKDVDKKYGFLFNALLKKENQGYL